MEVAVAAFFGFRVGVEGGGAEGGLALGQQKLLLSLLEVCMSLIKWNICDGRITPVSHSRTHKLAAT